VNPESKTKVEGTGLMVVSRRGCTSRLEPPEHVDIKPGQPFSSPCRNEKLNKNELLLIIRPGQGERLVLRQTRLQGA
jgi:hypothetical protein